MNPILYEANTTSFATNGLGRLSDCISCTVEEVVNGIFELEMVYPINGIHYSLIEEHRIIYAPHDDTKLKQPFEIYRISKPINGKVTINGWHISYRLRKMVCLPFTATSAADAMNSIENNIVGTNPFTFSTDKATSVTMKQRSPVVVKSLMGGMQGSVIDTYGGEWEYNNYICTLKNRRGMDTDVSIRYGKNLTSVKKVSDTSNLWTGIIPYWEGTDDQDNEIQVYYNGVIYSSVHEDYPYDMIIAVDASSDFEEEPTQAQLESWGQSYVNFNARSSIPTSVDISFIELWQTEEYKNVSALQRLFIGDSVHVYYEALGIDYTARIVKYKYNVLLERYDSMTLGGVRASFTSAVKGDIEAIVGDIETNIKNLPTKSFVDQIVEYQTDLIRGGLGGYVVLNPNADGEPQELLILDNPSIASAVNVIRINKNGIGFSTTGYSGQYRNAWTIAGILNADFIAAGTMLADRIQGGTLSLGGRNNGNGVLRVYNSSGVQIGKWDKDGADITGKLTLIGDNTQCSIGDESVIAFFNTGFWRSADDVENFHYKVYDANRNLTDTFVLTQVSTDGVQESVTTVKDRRYRAIGFATGYSSLDNIPKGPSSTSAFKYVVEETGVDNNGYAYWRMSADGVSLRMSNKLFRLTSVNSSGLEIDYNNDIIRLQSTNMASLTGNRIQTTNSNVNISGAELVVDSANQQIRIGCNRGAYATSKTIYNSGSTLYWNGGALQMQSSSSKRYKHDIASLTDKELDPHKLYNLPVRQFVYNGYVSVQYEDMRDQTLPGFIAEEVAEIYSSAVIHNQDGDIESWDERRILPPMLSLIQEQHKQIEKLAEKLSELERRIA